MRPHTQFPQSSGKYPLPKPGVRDRADANLEGAGKEMVTITGSGGGEGEWVGLLCGQGHGE